MRVNTKAVKTIGAKAFKSIGGFAKSSLEIAIPIIGVMIMNSSVSDIIDEMRYRGNIKYDDVVSAIAKSNMLSSDRVKMISELKSDGNSDYYKAVISIIRSNMFSSSKLEAIRGLNNNDEEK